MDSAKTSKQRATLTVLRGEERRGFQRIATAFIVICSRVVLSTIRIPLEEFLSVHTQKREERPAASPWLNARTSARRDDVALSGLAWPGPISCI
eukprot:COSAG06_NODE_3433_length_5355_cov_6.170282_4_plen_94_part_00